MTSWEPRAGRDTTSTSGGDSTSRTASPQRPDRAAAPSRAARAQQLLALFAWHRDAPLVAKSLRLSLDELDAELDGLKLRRKAYRLVRGSDTEMPVAKAVPGAPSGPPVRRRSKRARPEGPASVPPMQASPGPQRPQPPAAAGVEAQAAGLRRLLAEVGARRGALAARLGSPGRPMPEKVLLARFRAAGLERELGQRERDLIRALFARHRGAARPVAGELGLEPAALQQLLRDRGLLREIEELRERFRGEARRRSWPRDQIEQLLRKRDWLDDLGIATELEREVLARARPAWQRAGGSAQLLQRELRVSASDARALRDLLERPPPSR